MKILAVADVVSPQIIEKKNGKLPIEGIDCIISCGDLPPEFLAALRDRYDVPLYYVLGNHDLRYSSPPAGCELLDKKLVVFQNKRIMGFSGSRWYNGGCNQFTEQQMAATIRSMYFQLLLKRGVDLIVTHSPPRHIHDAEDPCHKGFRSFRKIIERYRPQYFIHGHIHQSFAHDSERMTEFASTKIVNSYGYTVFEI